MNIQIFGTKKCNDTKKAEPEEGCQMSYSEILNGTEYDFLKTNEHLGKHVILLGLAGSYSYGTNMETRDIDLSCIMQPRI